MHLQCWGCNSLLAQLTAAPPPANPGHPLAVLTVPCDTIVDGGDETRGGRRGSIVWLDSSASDEPRSRWDERVGREVEFCSRNEEFRPRPPGADGIVVVSRISRRTGSFVVLLAERKAWEKEKREIEEERRRRAYAEEVKEARKRRESQRFGMSASPVGGDYTEARRSAREKDGVPVSSSSRRQASEPSPASSSYHSGSPRGSRPSSLMEEPSPKGSPHGSRPASLHTTGSREDVRASMGAANRRMSQLSDANVTSHNHRPSADRANSLPLMYPVTPMAIPVPVPVSAMQYMPPFAMELPLLPPTAPFMVQQYPPPKPDKTRPRPNSYSSSPAVPSSGLPSSSSPNRRSQALPSSHSTERVHREDGRERSSSTTRRDRDSRDSLRPKQDRDQSHSHSSSSSDRRRDSSGEHRSHSATRKEAGDRRSSHTSREQARQSLPYGTLPRQSRPPDVRPPVPVSHITRPSKGFEVTSRGRQAPDAHARRSIAA